MSEKHIGTRADYRWFTTMPTRWMDNDVFGHVNNVQYYSYVDTAVAEFLLQAGMYGDRTLNLAAVPAVGLVVETQCRYFAPLSYPDELTCGLRVAKLGRSSIRYELGIFRNAEQQACAEAHFVHVYVDRQDQSRTVPVPEKLRAAAQRVLA